ncbi:MAG: hypothetical protein JETCAE03_32180 [Ignavibacteriaceae bacterium]|jgi:hypothetical protein|nr:MAG: hypothetical protein JETCAE03_32180 [Ignavibacteriaceae bacterium]
MSKNNIIILNGIETEEYEIVKEGTDIKNDKKVYFVADKNKEMFLVEITKIVSVKKLEI